MKAEIKIPKGWERLIPGQLKKSTDLWLDKCEMEWKPCQTRGYVDKGTYIRKKGSSR